MPRIAERRPPVEPNSAPQRERRRRILSVAARHGATLELDRVQMHEIAAEAEVAIATLYRYFPSKNHLFVALLTEYVQRLDKRIAVIARGQDRAEFVADILVAASRQMAEHHTLANNMLQALNASITGVSTFASVQRAFMDLLLRTTDIAEPTDEDLRMLRLVQQCWFGVLTSYLGGHLSAEEADADTRLVCERLLWSLGGPA